MSENPHADGHPDELEPYAPDDDEVFTFRLRLLYQSASWPATVWSAFASILSVCVAAVLIALILAWAPAENVEAMGTLFRKPGATSAPPKSAAVFTAPDQEGEFAAELPEVIPMTRGSEYHQ